MCNPQIPIIGSIKIIIKPKILAILNIMPYQVKCAIIIIFNFIMNSIIFIMELVIMKAKLDLGGISSEIKDLSILFEIKPK